MWDSGEYKASHADRGSPVDGECRLSVVLPCRDEAATVALCVRQAQEGIARLGVCGEVLVVDNDSRDDSAALARAAGARVIRVHKRGYGAALREGISCARGVFVVLADTDASYDLANLDLFWQRLLAGDDLVVGNRFQGGVATGAMPFWNRRLGNPVLSWCGRTLFAASIGDFHCGMRAFRRAAIIDLNLRSDGMEFATEIIARAMIAGLVVSEVPTPFAKARRAGHSHLRPIRDGLRHLGLMIAVSSEARFAKHSVTATH